MISLNRRSGFFPDKWNLPISKIWCRVRNPAVVAALESAGMTKEHARDYAVIGCVEMASQGRTYNSSDACLFNLPICLELALNEGRRFMGWNPACRRFGASTPPVEQMISFDDVVAAFRAQVNDALAEMVKVISWLEKTYRPSRPGGQGGRILRLL